MNTLTKLVLGAMGQLRPKPVKGDAVARIALPAPRKTGGIPLMEAIAARHSAREFSSRELPLQMLSNMLWAADGINRADGGEPRHRRSTRRRSMFMSRCRRAHTCTMPAANALQLVAGSDLRRVTGYQDFVDDAALDLVYVADHSRMKLVPAASRASYASVAAGAITQNVYLFAAGNGLATVIRAWIDRDAIANALGLGHDHQVLFVQTVGFPKS